MTSRQSVCRLEEHCDGKNAAKLKSLWRMSFLDQQEVQYLEAACSVTGLKKQ